MVADRDADKGAAELGALHAELAARSVASHAKRLGLDESADKPIDKVAIRKAFLALVREFHPHRYSHLGKECERIANEIFLLVKEAHDELIKAANCDEDAGVDVVARAKSEPVRRPGSEPSRARAGSEPLGKPATSRRQRRTSVPPDRTSPPRTVRFRDGKVIDEDPAKTDQLRPLVAPVGGPPPPARTQARRTNAAAPVPPPEPPTLAPLVDHSALVAKLESEEEGKLDAYRTASRLLKDGRAGEARIAFRKLAVANPTDKRYRVYMHFSWGREHELAGRTDSAATEYQRALNVNPTFTPALEALEALQAQSDRPGVFGRLFRSRQK